jgi:hypothetical protein
VAHLTGEMEDKVTGLGQVASDMEEIQSRYIPNTSLHYCYTNMLNMKEMTRITEMVCR